MTHNSKSMLAGSVLILALLACTLSGTAQPISVNDQAATTIASTLTAQADIGSDVPTDATAAVTTTKTPTPNGGSTAGVTPTITPTYSTPMLTVLEQTNCREGPGQEYRVIFTYLATVKLEIIGRYEPTNFWLVNSPESSSGTCWLWGEYVELSGSYWVVPTLTPPPTETLPPPPATFPTWDFTCSGGNISFSMAWEDRATNETGYRVFRDGEAVAELPANSTSWSETIPLEAGESLSYYLQVYGPTGTADSSVIRVGC
ncbi:MAG TPA: SH3 domain-containing protein [Anaerolineales bacterium]|nr:SH3 domain-containing protein [Anaerolineales bacterium]